MTTPNTSHFERLPLELKNLIFQAYLNSIALDHNNLILHNEHLREKAWRKEWPRLLKAVGRGRDDEVEAEVEDKYYRQDPNDGSGYWSPFGVTTQILPARWNEREFSKAVVKRKPPLASWQIGSVVGRSAREYQLYERMRLTFTEVTR